MPLRARSPLEDPTARYVPHNPTAGLTAVGIRKDMGLFPDWRLLCYSKNQTKQQDMAFNKKAINIEIN